MKRLNINQQDHLNRKFRNLCETFLNEQRKPLEALQKKIKPCIINAKVELSTTFCARDPFNVNINYKTLVLPPAFKALTTAFEAYAKVRMRVHELQEQFAERVMFSTNDYEEVHGVLDTFKARIK